MYCSKCGSLLSQDAKFCSKCGVAVLPPSAEEGIDNVAPIVQNSMNAKHSIDLKVIAKRVVIFVVATTFWLVVGNYISRTVGGIVAQNAATTALALLIGCFSLGSDKRKGLTDKTIAVLFFTYIPISFVGAMFAHDAVLRDPQSMAKTGQFIYSVVVALVAYRIASRFSTKKNV